MDVDFSYRRARSLARLSAYTLLVIFLIGLIAAALPLPLADPQRILNLIAELLQQSPLPVVALLFLFFGMAEDSLPALWECRLARWLRPLLRLVALLYLLAGIAVFGASQRLAATGVNSLNTQLQASFAGIQRLRQSIEQAPDGPSLRRLLDRQPALLQTLNQEGIVIGGTVPLPEQKRSVGRLVDLAESNLRSLVQKGRANSSGNRARLSIRLALTAFTYALFYLLAGLLWPGSVAATVERIRAARLARQESESEAEEIDSLQA